MEAVVLLDVLVARSAVSVGALTEYAQARVGLPGWSRLVKAIRLIDAGARSAQETRLRVRLVLAGVPEHRIAVEPDSGGDSIGGARSELGADWLVLPVSAQRLRADPTGPVKEVKAALRARRPRT